MQHSACDGSKAHKSPHCCPADTMLWIRTLGMAGKVAEALKEIDAFLEENGPWDLPEKIKAELLGMKRE